MTTTKIWSGKTVREYRKVLSVLVNVPETGVPTLAHDILEQSRSRRFVLQAAFGWLASDANRMEEMKGWHRRLTLAEIEQLKGAIPFEVRAPKRKAYHLTEKEIEKLEASFVLLDNPVQSLVMLLYKMDFRCEELVTLTRGAVEETVNKSRIRFIRKGNKEVELPIGNRIELFKALLNCKSVDGSTWSRVGELLVPSQNVESYKAKMRKVVAEFGKRIGLPLHPHILRAAFAQRMLRSGKSLVDVRDWLGHESVETTQKYVDAATKEDDLFD